MKVLECSSHGDIRFSAFGARIKVYGVFDTIENHYQLSKRFGYYKPTRWESAKGRTPTHFEVNGKEFDIKYLPSYYKMLWVEYLDSNPLLVKYAKGFDDFHDKFKGKKSKVCQADVIRQYIKEGRESVAKECEEFMNLLEGEDNGY
jgi:hypothetical protein